MRCEWQQRKRKLMAGKGSVPAARADRSWRIRAPARGRGRRRLPSLCVELVLERFDYRPMQGVRFFITQGPILSAILKPQRYRAFGVGDSFTLICSHEAHTHEVIHFPLFG